MLVDLKLQIILNHIAITKKSELLCIILVKRYIKKTVSNYKVTIKY